MNIITKSHIAKRNLNKEFNSKIDQVIPILTPNKLIKKYIIRSGNSYCLKLHKNTLKYHLDNDCITIGYNIKSNIKSLTDEEIKTENKQNVLINPNYNISETSLKKRLTQIKKFAYDIKKGDEILTWDIVNKCYHCGVVTSEYVYSEMNLDGDNELSLDHYYHKLYVKWFKDTLKKEDLDKSITNFISKYHTGRGTVFEIHT